MNNIIQKVAIGILTIEARMVIFLRKPYIVLVTGSVGKTSTKDSICLVLSKNELVRKTSTNCNTKTGACRVVLGLLRADTKLGVKLWLKRVALGLLPIFSSKDYPSALVIEVGIDRPGGMKSFLWLKPDVLVYTRFPDVPAHVEDFSSAEEVIQEKLRIKENLVEDGVLIVNADDPKMNNIEVHNKQKKLAYGLVGTNADIHASQIKIDYKDWKPVGIKCLVAYKSEVADLKIQGKVGKHHMYPLLAAILVGLSKKMPLSEAIKTLEEKKPSAGRMSLHDGINNSTIIDDAYNALPVSVHAAIDTLSEIETKGRKILVLGDMLKLGKYSDYEHEFICEHAVASCDVFVVVGERMGKAVKAILPKESNLQHIEQCDNAKVAAQYLKRIVKENDIVLIKGSNAMKMKTVVKELCL